MLIVYAYAPNAILMEPINDRTGGEILKGFNRAVEYLKERGYRAVLNIMDNETSKELKHCIKKVANSALQLVEPHNHRANAAEIAIQTAKDHIIAGLCLTDPNFPIFLWDEAIIPQAQLTLNMLRTSRTNPRLSAQMALDGIFNFNKTPLAPPGT